MPPPEPSALPAKPRLRGLHVVTAIAPLGLFLTVHAIQGAFVMVEPRAFAGRPGTLPILSKLSTVLATGLYLSMAYHAGHWLHRRVARSRPPPTAAARSGRPTIEHVAGPLALAFLVYHLAHTKISVLTGTQVAEDHVHHLAARLSSTSGWGIPWPALAYLVGVGASSVVLAQGLLRATRSLGSESWAQPSHPYWWLSVVFGAALFVVFALTVLHLATGTPSWL
jgi:hypothetical protein